MYKGPIQPFKEGKLSQAGLTGELEQTQHKRARIAAAEVMMSRHSQQLANSFEAFRQPDWPTAYIDLRVKIFADENGPDDRRGQKNNLKWKRMVKAFYDARNPIEPQEGMVPYISVLLRKLLLQHLLSPTGLGTAMLDAFRGVRITDTVPRGIPGAGLIMKTELAIRFDRFYCTLMPVSPLT